MSDAPRSSERPAEASADEAPGRSLAGPRIVGAALLVLGAAVLYGALQIGQGTGFRPVGPSFLPIVVGAGLVVLAAVFLVRTTVRVDEWLAERAAEERRATSWPTILALAIVLVAYALALGPVGYVISTALLVPVVAWLLGSRSVVRDVAVGLAIALAVWFGFTEFLGVRLPAGLLEPII